MIVVRFGNFTAVKIALRNRIGTDAAAGAFLAKITEVELIDPFHHGLEMHGIIGEETRLKVAFVRRLCPESRTGEVGGADEGVGAIDDDGFGVNARAEDALEEMAVDEVRVAIKVSPKARARFFGVHEADVDTLLDQVGKNFEQGDEAFALGHMEVFDVGGDDPQELPSLR